MYLCKFVYQLYLVLTKKKSVILGIYHIREIWINAKEYHVKFTLHLGIGEFLSNHACICWQGQEVHREEDDIPLEG